ncbi:hypothetical protein [Endozoicomonas sp. GU-1]|uniref:hypothetical protein n=1 Tax=Endozoicomonas sp. GU-1 TaxID=3009078 RepID=UPI0022B4D71D|nr:hypothetical protein [Endozoicomonas sp. GU-1]WBA79557.1 hypothetical protein O2T12_14330 [Endozoicomonas sp. GU-1]
MSKFYQDKAQTITKLLKKFGQPFVLVRDKGKCFDPVTGVCTPGEPEYLKFNGILKSYSASLIDGTKIIQGDQLLLLDACHTPKKGDKAKFPDGDWQIVSIEPVIPAGVPLAYKIQVRR